MWLNSGRKRLTIRIATITERRVIKVDSLRYCHTKELFSAPTAFLMPTSLALREALAVDRFMKLMQAIINMKTAMAENSHT